MRKILLICLSILLMTTLGNSAPSTTMTLQYDPNSNDTISSSSYKAEENHQITQYNSHNHTDITSLGTITTGVWNGTAIGATYGGIGQTTATQGDILYASASNTWSKLGAGTSGQFLKTQGASANPTWASIYSDTRFKVVTSTRVMDAVSGNVSYTGAGFTPAGCNVLATTTAAGVTSWGIGAGTTNSVLIDNNASSANTYAQDSTKLIAMYESGSGTSQVATISSMDSDGFTLTWTKTGSPTANTIYMHIEFSR